MKIDFVKEQKTPSDTPIWYTNIDGDMVSGSCNGNRGIALTVYNAIVENKGKNPFPSTEIEKTIEL